MPTTKCGTDAGQQNSRVEGLTEKADRAGAQRPLTKPVVGKSCDDDDGSPGARRGRRRPTANVQELPLPASPSPA